MREREREFLASLSYTVRTYVKTRNTHITRTHGLVWAPRMWYFNSSRPGLLIRKSLGQDQRKAGSDLPRKHETKS